MKEIPLTQGKVALVDDEDFGELSKYKWSAALIQGIWYATRGVAGAGNRKTTTIYMHRCIAGAAPGELVDHWSGDSLDNRRQNLRVCSESQNAFNRKVHKNNTSGLTGAFYSPGAHVKGRPWKASICVRRKVVSLGYFATAEEAHQAWLEAAVQYFGAVPRGGQGADHREAPATV